MRHDKAKVVFMTPLPRARQMLHAAFICSESAWMRSGVARHLDELQAAWADQRARDQVAVDDRLLQ